MDALKLENQLCFPLYVCAKEVVRRYRPLLEPLGLTYTQYIAMMAFWEHKTLTVGRLGELLHLDSGTLTPVLKKMEKSGWIRRERSRTDERQTIVTITPDGEALRERAADVPQQMMQCAPLESDEAVQLYTLLYKLINSMSNR